MPREYALSVSGSVTGAALTTELFLNPGTTATLEIIRAWASYAPNATSGQQRIQISTQVTSFPTLVTTGATLSPLNIKNPASVLTLTTTGAAGTAGVLASGEGAGAKTIVYNDAFNVLNGWLWVPTPPETMVMNAGSASGWGLCLPVQPTTLTSWQFGVVFREW